MMDSKTKASNLTAEAMKNHSSGDYVVISKSKDRSNKFNTDVSNITIKFKEITKNPQKVIKATFDQILKEELKDVKDQDRVGITLSNQNYNKPIYVTLRPRNQIISEVILAEVERVVQSNENFFLNEPLNLKITAVHLPGIRKR